MIRAALIEDAERISAVLKRSIIQLCRADHGGAAEHIESWTAHKTPEDIRRWIFGKSALRVSLSGQEIAAVGGYDDSGAILLLYVDPAYQGQGHSSALLKAMEAEIAALGHNVATLVSSKTAQAFYESRGWKIDGPRVTCYSTDGQPMSKKIK